MQHTFSNVGGLLTFDNDDPGLDVPADAQFIIELTVVLDDTPANTPGTQFVNTAKWDFGRLIDGVFYEPLPGEWGIIAADDDRGAAAHRHEDGSRDVGRTLNLGQWGQFGIDVRNSGLTPAWNATIVDRLPDGPLAACAT